MNNEYGGIKVGDDRYKVDLVLYDDKGDGDTTARLVEKLISEDNVDFLLGPYSSGLTQRAIEVAEKHGTIMVEGNGSSETLFAQGFQNLFAVLTPAGDYTQSALQLLAEQGAKTVVIAHEDAAFATSVAAGAQRWATEYGLEILSIETYPQGATDVGDIISEFKEMAPDVFVGGGHYNDAILFIQTAKALDFNPQAMVLTVGPSNPRLVAEVGADADYVIGPTQWEASMSYRGEHFGSASDYATRYQEMWDEAPTYQAAESTAAALALHLAIEAAGSLDTDAVRTALRDLDVATFYGPINFDETGKNAAKPMGAIQIQNGEILVIAPSNAAVADLLYPKPAWAGTSTATAAEASSGYDNQLAGLGPLAWWKMQEASGTIRNSGSLTGVDGTPRGTPDYRQPGPGSAIPYGIQLSGNGEDFSVPDVSGLRLTGSYTLLAWIKPDTVAAGNGSIVTKEGNHTGYWLYREGSRLYTGFKDGTAGPYKAHISSAVLSAGQWVFVASTWDGTTSRLYLNGAEVSAQALSGSLVSDTNPLTIGSTGLGVDHPGAYFDGTLAQVAVFDKVLTAQDLAALYTAGGP